MSRRAGLDRAAVVRAAGELADAAGGEVTLAALAAHLGVRTPSLYNHVAGQEGLRRELALLGLRGLTGPVTRAAVGRSGADAVLAMARAYRQFAREHPGLYQASLRAPDPADAELNAAADELLSVIWTVMASLGFAGDDAVHAVRGLRALWHGFVALEAAGGFGIPLDLDASFERAVRAYVDGITEGALR